MPDTEDGTFELARKVRCLEAIVAEREHSNYIVGTTDLHRENLLLVLSYDKSTNKIAQHSAYAHPNQVLDVAPNPTDAQIVATCHKSHGSTPTATLWKMPEANTDVSSPRSPTSSAPALALETISDFSLERQPINRVVWNPFPDSTSTSELSTAHESVVRTWTLENGALEAKDRLELDLSMGGQSRLDQLVWDPHHRSCLSFTLGNAIQTWDTRTSSIIHCVSNPHLASTLSLDYNPNRPHCLLSGGDDGKIKFWDLRKPSLPLKSLQAHDHWVTKAKFNRYHDQLVLTSSSDASVALWRVSSVSSSPLVDLSEEDLAMGERHKVSDVLDGHVATELGDHQDSVYGVSWAAHDSWSFASVSYDGKVAMNQVPSSEKYKILL